MSDLILQSGLFLLPTPAGAYYAVASDEQDKPRKFLSSLLQYGESPALSEDLLVELSQAENTDKAKALLHHCQELGWVQGLQTIKKATEGALEDILPSLLEPLSESGKVLLADDQGFYLASCGFAHETAEELSALSAEIATLHIRRSGLLNNNLGLSSHAWSIVDAYGNSQVGFWPLFIGKHRFVVSIEGIPHFNHAEFISLAWALMLRYAGRFSKV